MCTAQIDLSDFQAEMKAQNGDMPWHQGAQYFYALLDIPLMDPIDKESYFDDIVIVRTCGRVVSLNAAGAF